MKELLLKKVPNWLKGPYLLWLSLHTVLFLISMVILFFMVTLGVDELNLDRNFVWIVLGVATYAFFIIIFIRKKHKKKKSNVHKT